MRHVSAIWAVIPAAGTGSRMQAERPKQYLELSGMPVIEHTIRRLLSHPAVCGAVVALDAQDEYWSNYAFDWPKPVYRVEGGKERSDSVYHALGFLSDRVGSDECWVMVHDAARPCIESSDLNALVEAVSHSGKGAILGYPCRDSMKRASIEFPSEIACSVERAQLWHALTPQMFLLNELLPAYEWVRQQGVAVTDDAMVMEMRGHGVRLVEGSELNIKITRPDDLILAKAILSAMDQRENVFVQ